RQPAHARAGGNDHRLLRLVLLILAVRGLDGDGVLAGEDAGALDVGDLVFLEQELDAFGVLGAHGARTFHRHAVFELHFAHADTEVRGVLDTVGDRSGLEQGLGRDAAPQDAGAAQTFALDDRSRQT